MSSITAIGFDAKDDTLHAAAVLLAADLHLIVDQQILPRLCFTEDKLVLLAANFSPLFVDFSPSVWRSRREAGKKQGLVRACKPNQGLRILDATAGWGQDAAILASFGAEVLMLERQPIMAALLADGLRRMSLEPSLALTLSLSLLKRDTKDYLMYLESIDYPDVIYIDPMHPLRKKSALVKKEMQALQQAIGADHDAAELITLAITRVKQRVVVKWPQRLPPLLTPNVSISGKTVRFDIYFPIGS